MTSNVEPKDPSRFQGLTQPQIAAKLLEEFRELRKLWNVSDDQPAQSQNTEEPPAENQQTHLQSDVIDDSSEILREVELQLGMKWFETLTKTVAPWAVHVTDDPKWVDPPKLAYWATPSGLHLKNQAPQNLIKILFEKRVLWHQHIMGLTKSDALQQSANEFDSLTFGVQPRNCQLCGKEYRAFSSMMEFAETNPWHLLHKRIFCSQSCLEEGRWQDTVRQGMHPDAIFDKSVTRDAIWDRFGPRCYLCGKEVFYKQPDLSLRNKSKAWKARWGEVDKYDQNRKAVVEHLVPRSKGGPHTWDNVKIACSECNLLKGDDSKP
jgi:hypothetical protein